MPPMPLTPLDEGARHQIVPGAYTKSMSSSNLSNTVIYNGSRPKAPCSLLSCCHMLYILRVRYQLVCMGCCPQACVLYVLRVGVIEQLGEVGQRLLLDRLLAVLSAPLGAHTPVAVVTLEALALLLEVRPAIAPY